MLDLMSPSVAVGKVSSFRLDGCKIDPQPGRTLDFLKLKLATDLLGIQHYE